MVRHYIAQRLCFNLLVLIQVVNLNTATIALTSSLNPANVCQSVIFTATAVGIGATPEVVPFYDGATPIGTADLSAEGIASISTSTLTQGTHIITATLPATATHTAATSAPVREVILQPGFSLTGNSITFLTGKSGTGDLQLTSLEGFAGNVTITCNPSFLPGYTCSLQVSSISLTSGQSTTFTYTLKPSYTASTKPSNSFNRTSHIAIASLFPFALLSLTGLRTLLGLTFRAILCSATTACGPDQFIAAPSPGTYPITFTAIGIALHTANCRPDPA